MDFDDDDDYDFLYDDNLSDEEKEELEKQRHEAEIRLHNHPLYKKAEEIDTLVDAILESIPEEQRAIYSSTLTESAIVLAPKIACAIGSESWLICMQNAAIIRHHAEYLLFSTYGLSMLSEESKEEGEEVLNNEYIHIMRREMEEFQHLFREWVKEFDTMQDEGYEDDWGLFLRNKKR